MFIRSNTTSAIVALALTITTAAFVDSFVPKGLRSRSSFPCVSLASRKQSMPAFRSLSHSATAVSLTDYTSTPPPPQHYNAISSIAESIQHGFRRWLSSLVSSENVQDGLSGDISSNYLVHSGPTTPMLIRAASVASFTLAQGWSNGEENSSLEAFNIAVRDVVRANPILTGRAISMPGDRGLFGGDDIRVVPSAFLPYYAESNSFVEVIDARDKLPSPLGLPKEKLLNYIDEHVAPIVPNPCAPTIDQIENRSPLFRTKVVLLPDSYACFYVGMSHCLGDISTFTSLLDQLSSSHAGRHKPHPIDWDNTLKATHQLSPTDFSDRDTCIAYGLPFLVGAGANVIGRGERKNAFLTLSAEKILSKRHELCKHGTDDDGSGRRSGGEPLSSNDVITAALCEACGSSDIFAFTRSMREMRHSEYANMAGNLYVEIPFSRREGSDPNAVRRIMRRGRYYERDELPLWPFLSGRAGRITSCVKPKGMKIEFGNTETVCHSPPKAFLSVCPFDCAVIFSMDKDHVGVMHNFWEVDETGLLGQLKA